MAIGHCGRNAERQLVDGDTISVGQTRLVVQIEGAEETFVQSRAPEIEPNRTVVQVKAPTAHRSAASMPVSISATTARTSGSQFGSRPSLPAESSQTIPTSIQVPPSELQFPGYRLLDKLGSNTA